MDCDTPRLEREWRAVYGAYVYLRAHDLSALSMTSRLLRQGDLVLLARRAHDELEELRGAVAGTHGHGHGRADIVLEAYQSLYWLMLLAVAAGNSYDDLCPHAAPLISGDERDLAAARDTLLADGMDDAGLRRRAVRAGFSLVQTRCAAGGVPVAAAIRRDLEELRAKPYLTPYWATYDAHYSAGQRVVRVVQEEE